MRCGTLVSLGVLSGLLPGPAVAQFSQYTPPGGLSVGATSTKQAMEKSVANAPWKVGPFRFQPYLGLKDLGYVRNLATNSGTLIDDYTASFGLGLKAYLPVGPKVVFAAHYLPEYTWWQESEDLRGWHLRSGLGMYAFFNRLTIEVAGTGTDLLDYVSSEFDSPATVERLSLGLNAHLDLYGPWGVQVAADYDEASYDDTGVENVFGGQLELLDRTEQRVRAGVSYTLRNGLRVVVGAQWSEVSFDNPERDRSNDGLGEFVSVSHTGTRWAAGIDLTHHQLDPLEGSEFVPFEGFGGQARLTWRGRNRIGLTGYAGRNIVFSLDQGSSYFLDQRYGAAVDWLFGWRTQLRVFGELGDNEYKSVSGAPFRRQDDYLGYGADVQFKFSESTAMVVGFARQEYDSTLNGFDREITTLRVSVNLGSGLLSPW